MDESKRTQEAELKKREQLSKQFQGTINDITTRLEADEQVSVTPSPTNERRRAETRISPPLQRIACVDHVRTPDQQLTLVSPC
jgi:hypothetical protein